MNWFSNRYILIDNNDKVLDQFVFNKKLKKKKTFKLIFFFFELTSSTVHTCPSDQFNGIALEGSHKPSIVSSPAMRNCSPNMHSFCNWNLTWTLFDGSAKQRSGIETQRLRENPKFQWEVTWFFNLGKDQLQLTSFLNLSFCSFQLCLQIECDTNLSI